MIETDLRRLYVARCTAKFRDVRMFIRNVGAIEVDGRVFKAGIKGQSDIYGYLLREPFSVPFEVECKNVKTPETPAQTTWANFCSLWRVPRLQVRANRGETPDQIVDRWAAETESFFRGISEKHQQAFTSTPSRSAS